MSNSVSKEVFSSIFVTKFMEYGKDMLRPVDLTSLSVFKFIKKWVNIIIILNSLLGIQVHCNCITFDSLVPVCERREMNYLL